jgi:hypothetical protein
MPTVEKTKQRSRMAEFHRLYGTGGAVLGRAHKDAMAERPRVSEVCRAVAWLLRTEATVPVQACRLQTSARAGTIFHKPRTPLTKRFLAMHLMTAAKNDIAAFELARQIDVTA